MVDSRSYLHCGNRWSRTKIGTHAVVATTVVIVIRHASEDAPCLSSTDDSTFSFLITFFALSRSSESTTVYSEAEVTRASI